MHVFNLPFLNLNLFINFHQHHTAFTSSLNNLDTMKTPKSKPTQEADLQPPKKTRKQSKVLTAKTVPEALRKM
jgi:hypothetical protein